MIAPSLFRVAPRGLPATGAILFLATLASAQASLPKTLTRAGGTVSLVANPLGKETLKIDGRLDEAIYSRFDPASDFIQQEPKEGEPATEKTEAWVFFDDKNIYVAARCTDTHPERRVANELRRDNFNLFENDNFAVILDTFHDKRNGYLFYTTPLGGLFDGIVTDEANTNRDWNTVWDAKPLENENGWTVEFAIPFKSLRYGPEGPWGINLRRRVRWKNETSFLTAIPASFGRRGIQKVSSAADLTGLATPKSSRAFEMKPYALGGFQTDKALEDPNDLTGEVGFDAKLTVSSALVADLTYNTDFAQVEDDLQQVNLGRSDIFYPEKREFFLEGQGLFAMGSQGGGGGGGQFGGSQAPIIFFSRRIGITDDVLDPIRGGGRLTGKASAWSFGGLQMRTGRDEVTKVDHTDFSVLRVKRNILKRSTVGVIATRRDDSSGAPRNLVYGSDLNLAFGSTVKITGVGSLSDTGAALSENNLFYQGRFEWNADRYGFEADHVTTEENFLPQIGFVPRPNTDRNLVRARFSPRPERDSLRAVRKFNWSATFDNIDGASSGELESRQIEGRFETEFQNGDLFSFQFTNNQENVASPFEVAGGLFVPVGSYRFNEYEVRYQMGQQRKVAGSVGFLHGGFYGGTRTEYQFSQGRVEINPHLSLEPQIQVNQLDTPFGKVTTKLISARLNWTLTPRMLVSGLSQYNSTTSSVSTNIRFRWEYRPGSDLFVVYGDARDTTSSSTIPEIATRSFVVKFTRLFRF